MPRNQLETALWLESDRMGYLLDVLDKEELDEPDRRRVATSAARTTTTCPTARREFALYDALYPEGHPYRYLTIGKHEDLVAASVEDVKNFFRTWYVPANATLAIAGDIDVGETKKLVEKWFGAFPASKKPALVKIAPPVVAAKEIAVDDSFAKLRQITFAWHSPAAYADGDADLDILANALAAEGTGRLYKSLVYDKQLAQSVQAGQDGMTFSGNFTITVQLRSGADIDAGEADRARRGRSRDQGRARSARDRSASSRRPSPARSTDSRTSTGRARRLQEYNQFLGDPNKITWDLDRYRTATPAKIREVAANYLAPDDMITVITNPAGGAK